MLAKVLMLKNTLYMMLTTGIKLLSGIIVFVILARVLGPYIFGLLSYSFALSTLFVLIIDYGYSQKLLRDLATNPENVSQYLTDALNAKIALTIVTIFISITYFYFSSLGEVNYQVFFTLFFAAVLGSFAELFCIPLRAFSMFDLETNVTTISSTVHFILIICLVYFNADVLLISAGFLVSRALYLVMAFFACRKHIVSFNYQYHFSSIVSSLKHGFPYAIDTILTNLFYQIDSVLINHHLGLAAVGNYQALTKWLQGMMQMAPVLANVYMAPLSASQKDVSRNRELSNNLNLKMLIIGVLGWLVFNFCGEYLTHYIYGEEYIAINKLWPFVALLVWVRYLAGAQGVMLVACGLQSIRVYVQSISLVTFLILSPILMAEYGLAGVLISLAISIFLLFVCFICVLLFRGKSTGFNRYTTIFAVLMSCIAIVNLT